MSDDKVVLELSLDDKEYIDKLLKAKKQLQSLGDKKNIEGASFGIEELTKKLKDLGGPEILGKFSKLTGKFMKMAVPIAVVTGSVFALKSAFDAALEGERIKAVDAQFKQLTENIGLSTETLKRGLIEAAEGELSVVANLKLANEAMLKLGNSAERLPEIMTLAKQRAQVLGIGLKESFEEITNALASGSTRALKQLGMSVDQNKVLKDYAASLGVTVSALSEAGKKQAIVNAAIEVGKGKFKGINDEVTPLHQNLEKLEASYDNMTDAIKRAIVESWLYHKAVLAMTSITSTFGNAVKTYFGDETDKASMRITFLRKNIENLQEVITNTKPEKDFFDRIMGTSDEEMQKRLDSRVKQATQMMASAKEELAKLEDQHPEAAGKSKNGDDAIDQEEKLKQAAAFNKQLISMRQARADAEIQISASEAQLIQAENEKRVSMAADLQAQISSIEVSDNTPMQKMKLIEEAQKMHSDKMVAFERDEFQRKEAMWENYQRTSTSVLEGIARAAVQEGQKQNRALTNSGEVGKKAFTDLSNLGATAFDAIGRAAVNGSADMGKAMLGAIGTIASSWGKMMMLAAFSTWPAVQGPKLAAGAALMVLGGVLGAASSGGGGGVSASAGGSADLSSGSVVSSDRQDTAKPLMDETAMQKKQVSLVVQGNIYETDQTRQRLVELIREASDATDFRYNQIGK